MSELKCQCACNERCKGYYNNFMLTNIKTDTTVLWLESNKER